MRKPNIEIKRINLAKAEIQLNAYANQYQALKAKLDEVAVKFENKRSQVNNMKLEIAQAETVPQQ